MDALLATAIQENLSIPCRSDETIRELARGIRLHFSKFVKPLSGGMLKQARLGLGHSYSRTKVSICYSFAIMILLMKKFKLLK